MVYSKLVTCRIVIENDGRKIKPFWTNMYLLELFIYFDYPALDFK